ncbi:MAG TPA: hypothetical protein VFS43_37985 [Polyangiaceae bacterium]|nr:hypothetical protein [Polyangiaceae bacterium]
MQPPSPSPSPRRRPLPWALAALLAGPLAAAQSAPRSAPTAPAPGPGSAASSVAPGPRAAAPSVAPGPRAAASGASSRPPARFGADPPPSMTRRKWVYDVRLSRGRLSAAAPTGVDRGRPLATPRYTGRFAIELFVGSVLLDRVRFNLPLVDSGAWAGDEAGAALGQKLSTHKLVEVPDLDRATRAELVDGATGQRQRLVWPPVDGPPPPPPAPSASAAGRPGR